jgi:shikimate dehydrogenase
MAKTGLVETLQQHASNRLDPAAGQRRWLAAIVGDEPSSYSKSPAMWNAAFQALGLDATYVPLDVDQAHLGPLVAAIRESPQVAGFNVTVPHKVRVMDYLDQVDPKAALIGAVNTVARTDDGRLVGYNTDAQGGMDSLTRALPGLGPPMVDDLAGRRVLLLGAGGAGRAMAFALAEAVGATGILTIANRDAATGQVLANAVRDAYGNAVGVSEGSVRDAVPQADLIVNATTKGQTGLRHLASGRVTCLEPYSALAPANPATFAEAEATDTAAFYRLWYWASLGDIQRNQRDSNWIILTARQETAFFDLIYSPLETPLLAQARWTGHATLNGKWMIIAQAADAMVNRVMPRQLQEMGSDPQAAYQTVFEAMARVW